jgi:hypothetical protein
MNETELLSRITANPEIFGGKPIIRGMRISVELTLSLLAQGESTDALIEDYRPTGESFLFPLIMSTYDLPVRLEMAEMLALRPGLYSLHNGLTNMSHACKLSKLSSMNQL